MQFQSFPPLLRVEILSLHIRTIHLPCMTKITSFVIFSPRESLHVSLCIIPLLKYCEMDEFCRAKQFKLFISAFSLVSTKLLKSFSKKNKQKKNTHVTELYATKTTDQNQSSVLLLQVLKNVALFSFCSSCKQIRHRYYKRSGLTLQLQENNSWQTQFSKREKKIIKTITFLSWKCENIQSLSTLLKMLTYSFSTILHYCIYK